MRIFLVPLLLGSTLGTLEGHNLTRCECDCAGDNKSLKCQGGASSDGNGGDSGGDCDCYDDVETISVNDKTEKPEGNGVDGALDVVDRWKEFYQKKNWRS
mmetsp:Transcript_8354/g.16404  ORF Transcript_8354/g.16404 Transcript_8354/m.16404 type:complete len:100 (-) Transcript_8354:661-960(-)